MSHENICRKRLSNCQLSLWADQKLCHIFMSIVEMTLKHWQVWGYRPHLQERKKYYSRVSSVNRAISESKNRYQRWRLLSRKFSSYICISKSTRQTKEQQDLYTSRNSLLSFRSAHGTWQENTDWFLTKRYVTNFINA